MLPLLFTACLPPPADRIYAGGSIYTMVPEAPLVEMIAIDDGRIVAAGGRVEVLRYLGQDTDVVDLVGGALFPGFIDTHSHLALSGAELRGLDLTGAESLDEVLDRVARWGAEHPDEPWIQGGGWDPADFPEVDRRTLDRIFPDRPVYLGSYDGHSAWVNSAALAAAGITRDTADPRGGRIEHDRRGAPSGILREDAILLFEPHLPPFDAVTASAGLGDALRECGRSGITTVVDPNVEPWSLDAYARAEALRELTVRVYGAIEVDPDAGVAQVAEMARLRAEYSSELVQLSGAKLYLDGVIESQTAALLEPYSGGPEAGQHGALLFDDTALDALIPALDAAGFQLHAHSIGDAATRQYLDAIARHHDRAGPLTYPALAAHLQLVHPDDVSRFRELRVYASFSPLWAWPDDAVVELTDPVIGPDRLDRQYPIAALDGAGAGVVAGSDWSVSSMDPWAAIEVGVTRADPDGVDPNVLSAASAVDLDTMIAAYTRVAAEAIGESGELGTLSVGARADLVHVDLDPYTLPPEALSEVSARAVWLGGKLVWQDLYRPVVRP